MVNIFQLLNKITGILYVWPTFLHNRFKLTIQKLRKFLHGVPQFEIIYYMIVLANILLQFLYLWIKYDANIKGWQSYAESFELHLITNDVGGENKK